MSRIVKIGFVGLVIAAVVITSQSELKSTPQDIDVDHVFTLLEGRDGEEFDSDKGKRAVELATSFIKKHGVTPFDFGRDLYQSGDIDKAFYWFESVGIATNDPQYYYGRAFYEWKSGDTEAALRDVNFLIKKDLPPLIKARTYYLKGRMDLQSRTLEAAKVDFNTALEAYQSIEGKFGGQFLCFTLLARVAIYKKEYDRVEPLLSAALEAERKNVEIGNKPFGEASIHEIYAEMYFEQRKFKESLEENLKSHESYLQQGKKSSAMAVLTKVGLLYFINGDPETAHEISTEIWGRLENSAQDQHWAFNSATLAMLALCSKQMDDYHTRKDRALSWARADAGGQALIDLFEFLENEIQCPEIKE